jgi:hypothetical protein
MGPPTSTIIGRKAPARSSLSGEIMLIDANAIIQLAEGAIVRVFGAATHHRQVGYKIISAVRENSLLTSNKSTVRNQSVADTDQKISASWYYETFNIPDPYFCVS